MKDTRVVVSGESASTAKQAGGSFAARLALLLGLLALVAGGCSRERDLLGNPTDGSHRVTAFAVLDASGATLWKFSTPPPGIRSAEDVEYGQLPGGFRQEVPASGAAPRPFDAGEKLTVVIVTPEYVYRGTCVASDPTKPRCESWESAAPDEGTIDRALRGEKIGNGS
ncbi:MAG TPA: hypothetical protein VMN82_14690 [Thermoanaerobaculia bacterium]|nr:hypothetical protein [Thermoanaerobaculia bacterium]